MDSVRGHAACLLLLWYLERTPKPVPCWILLCLCLVGVSVLKVRWTASLHLVPPPGLGTFQRSFDFARVFRFMVPHLVMLSLTPASELRDHSWRCLGNPAVCWKSTLRLASVPSQFISPGPFLMVDKCHMHWGFVLVIFSFLQLLSAYHQL